MEEFEPYRIYANVLLLKGKIINWKTGGNIMGFC